MHNALSSAVATLAVRLPASGSASSRPASHASGSGCRRSGNMALLWAAERVLVVGARESHFVGGDNL